jgi:hypothetical protein
VHLVKPMGTHLGDEESVSIWVCPVKALQITVLAEWLAKSPSR